MPSEALRSSESDEIREARVRKAVLVKKNWEELREHIRYWRRRARQGMVKSNWGNFKFRTLFLGNEQRTRLYCLGMCGEDREHTLLYVDIPREFDGQRELILRPLLRNDSRKPVPGISRLSKEEELRRERMRCTISGITSYHLDSTSGDFLFTVGSQLVTAQDATLSADGVAGRPLLLPPAHTPIDPQSCPADHHLLAFASDGDVFLQYGETCKRATKCKTTPESPRYAGSPSFIIQEEFDRYSSMWWAPKSASDEKGRHHLLIEVTDEGSVMELAVSVPASLKGEVENMRYPRAGTENAVSTFKLLEIIVDPTAENDSIICVGMLSLGLELKTMFPWFEYIVRAGWLPDGSAIWAQLMSRRQERLALVLLPRKIFFSDSGSMTDLSTSGSDYSRLAVILHEEQGKGYINYHDFLHFLPSDDPLVMKFLWSSEKSGFDHIYLVTSTLEPSDTTHKSSYGALKSCCVGDCDDDDDSDLGSDAPLKASSIQTPITSGNWPIKRKVEPVIDEERGLIYFLAHKDSVVEAHIYVASYRNPGEARRLTECGKSDGSPRSDSLCIDTTAGLIVVWQSNLRSQPECFIYKLHFSIDSPLPTAEQVWTVSSSRTLPVKPSVELAAAPMEVTGEKSPASTGFSQWHISYGSDQRDSISDDAPELIEYVNSASGFTQYSLLIRPNNCQPGVQYPVLVYCYGGPEVQLVKNAWHTCASFQKYTNLGYAVVMTDGRGSAGRGYDFESAITEKMGLLEVIDQVEGLQAVAKQCGNILDFDRVAISGWSYGGYLSLQALLQRPDIFKIAIAGGPVTSWALYDTGYTERYMGLPQEKTDAYAKGSILNFADKFPNEPGRLLILHGLIDENVHFKHSAKLIEHLTRYGKPYDLRVFPRERHGVRSPEANEHMDATILNYLQTNL